MHQEPSHVDKNINLVFAQKSQNFPGGSLTVFSDGSVAFPELRFTPENGKKYNVDVYYYENRNRIIGIATPCEPETLSETEYCRDKQIVISVTFVTERGSDLVARHPVTGAYIIPAKPSHGKIREGVSCWVMLIQRGTILEAVFIKNVETEDEKPPESSSIVTYDPSFSARNEETLLAKRGMGKAPVFYFGGKNKFPWEILGIPKEATVDEIRKAYRRLSKTVHTDQSGNREDFEATVYACDWMVYRKTWADQIAKETATKAKQTKTETPKPVAKPVAPPKPAPAPATAGQKDNTITKTEVGPKLTNGVAEKLTAAIEAKNKQSASAVTTDAPPAEVTAVTEKVKKPRKPRKSKELVEV